MNKKGIGFLDIVAIFLLISIFLTWGVKIVQTNNNYREICEDNGYERPVSKAMEPGYIMCAYKDYDEKHQVVWHEVPVYVGDE